MSQNIQEKILQQTLLTYLKANINTFNYSINLLCLYSQKIVLILKKHLNKLGLNGIMDIVGWVQ